MTNYTDGQIEEIIGSVHAGDGMDGDSWDRILVRAALDFAERQAAKAGVTDEVVENACAIQNKIIAHNIGSTAIRKKGMRAALSSVWPTAGGDGKDAARYRHLRDWGVPRLCACIDGLPNYVGEKSMGEGAHKLDSAIDASIAAAEREKKLDSAIDASIAAAEREKK